MLISLAVKLQEKRHACRVICIANKGDLCFQAKNQGIKIASIEQISGFSLRALWRLCQLVKAENPDILHLHNGRAIIYGAIAGKILGIPCVFTRHGSGVLVTSKWLWAIINVVVAISQQAKNEMIRQNPCLKAGKVHVIINGVNIKDYETFNRTIKPSILTVGHVARLSAEKDQATLLRSFAIVVQSLAGCSVRLVIAGDGPEKVRLKILAQELGISAYVEFLGFREDIPMIVNSLDVFVLSSLTEGISLTLLEAMAASKPIVATDVGGNPEVVIDGKTGFLVPAQNPQVMADKILAILNDPDLAQRMGMAGHQRVEQIFSLDCMTEAYEKVYQEVLS